jgi:hypothetical protein
MNREGAASRFDPEVRRPAGTNNVEYRGEISAFIDPAG